MRVSRCRGVFFVHIIFLGALLGDFLERERVVRRISRNNDKFAFGLLRYISERPQTGGHPNFFATFRIAVEGAPGGVDDAGVVVVPGCVFCAYFSWRRAPRSFLEGVRVFLEREGVVRRISRDNDKFAFGLRYISARPQTGGHPNFFAILGAPQFEVLSKYT